jgi:hypothetical protein
VLQTSRRGSSVSVCCKLPGTLRNKFDRRVHRSVVEIESDVAISITSNSAYATTVTICASAIPNLRSKSNGSLSRHIHVIVLREIRSEVVGEQSVSAGVIRPTNVVSFVPIYLVRTPNKLEYATMYRPATIRFQRF